MKYYDSRKRLLRNEQSSKFKNFDLIGVPYQIIIGSKSNDDKLEFKELNAKTEMLTIEEIIKKIKKLKG